ncbi:MAG: hypothetical protein DME76_08345 [Verrucomicrobia bacterium]|nr:MAG: hypothetical protein DME76_08345 [Verrucomicrobiota bacterium]
MSKTAIAPLICQVCKKPKSPHNGMIAELIRPSLLEFIKKKLPDLDNKAFICFDDLGEFRKDYIKEVLEDEIGELSALDHEVIQSLEQHEILSADISKQFERKLTFGERLSDHIAEFGGSWRFLISFGAVLLIWIAINGVVLATRAFDPYPFILLNLILSCLAAVQAPIIMMSQNRAEARDRLRAENDYKVNLKAELEIRHLHEKTDHLLRRQYNRLFRSRSSYCKKSAATNPSRSVSVIGFLLLLRVCSRGGRLPVQRRGSRRHTGVVTITLPFRRKIPLAFLRSSCAISGR